MRLTHLGDGAAVAGVAETGVLGDGAPVASVPEARVLGDGAAVAGVAEARVFGVGVEVEFGVSGDHLAREERLTRVNECV